MASPIYLIQQFSQLCHILSAAVAQASLLKIDKIFPPRKRSARIVCEGRPKTEAILICQKSAGVTQCFFSGMKSVLLLSRSGENPSLAMITLKNRAPKLAGRDLHCLAVIPYIQGTKFNRTLTACVRSSTRHRTPHIQKVDLVFRPRYLRNSDGFHCQHRPPMVYCTRHIEGSRLIFSVEYLSSSHARFVELLY